MMSPRLQQTNDLRVTPTLCPLAVSPADFGQAGQLIQRSRAATAQWLSRPKEQGQTKDLALHSHDERRAAELTQRCTITSEVGP